MARWTARIPGGFIDLIRRLVISIPPGQDVPFELTGNVLPVAIVDPSPLTIVSSPPVMLTPASAGELAGPQGAGTVMADTGQLAAGNYYLIVFVGSTSAGSMKWTVERRNAANSANIWSQAGWQAIQRPTVILEGGFAVDNNERFRVVLQTATIGGDIVQANIFAAPLS